MKGERDSMSNSTRRSAGSLGRTIAVVFVVAAVAAGVLIASALGSSGGPIETHQAARKAGIAVFSRRPKLARVASASSLRAPSGAILAAVVGRTEVYALHHSGGDDCVMNLTAGASGGSVCAPASQVEERGEVGISQEGAGATAPNSPATLGITALVPNGVSSITITDRNGSSYSVPVSNNVAEREDINIASVSYTSGGGTQTTNVAAIVDHTPRQPGPAGSSR